MIILTRMDKQLFFVNPDHIITIEETPDTVITLFNGHHFIVKESAQSIIRKIISFRAAIIRRSGISAQKKYLRKNRTILSRFSCHHEGNVQQPENACHKTPFHAQDR